MSVKIPKAKIRLVMREWGKLSAQEQKDIMNKYNSVYGQTYTSQDWIDFLWKEFGLDPDQ